MEEVVFLEGEIPSDYQLDFEESIVNQWRHRSLHAVTNWYSYHVAYPRTKKIKASIHFYVANHVAVSPLRNPFGSIEMSHDLSMVLLKSFWAYIEESFRQKNVNQIHIQNPPLVFAPTALAVWENVLIDSGFTIKSAFENASIAIDESALYEKLHRSEKKRLRKTRQAKFEFRTLTSEWLDQAYHFIARCRASKGYTLSMHLSELRRAVEAFPDKYFFFGVFDRENLAAASISIRVNPDVLYDFYHDHDAAYNQMSPVVHLVEGIYQCCQHQQIKILDLGTSSLQHSSNEGLLNFKLRLGAVISMKNSFEKLLQS